jgi:NodT family efflux transporter outer membrane factor (OMF) lipoprotein
MTAVKDRGISLFGAALVVAMTLGTSACVVGPNYVKPTASVPGTFKEPVPPAFKETAGWKQGEPIDDMHKGKWWEIFNDPQLNALEGQIEIGNQTIAAQEAMYRSSRAAIRVARSAYYPTVTGGASLSGIGTSGLSSVGSHANQFAEVVVPSAGVSWAPDLFGLVHRQVENAVDTAQSTAANLENMRLLIQSEVASDYFSLHGLDAEKTLLDTNVTAYEKALQLTVNRYNQGVASQVDVAQAQTQLEQTRAQSTDTMVQRQQFEHAIAILLGKPPSEFAIPIGTLPAAPPPIPGLVPSQLLERRPDIAAQERAVAAANANIGVAIAAYYPTLTLSAAGGFEGTGLISLFSWPSRFWSLGPSLSETIWDNGKRRGITEEARAAYDVTVANYRESVLTAFQQVEDNLAALRILEQESREQAEAIRYAERSLQLAINQYEGGITTYLQVITAQAAALSNESTGVALETRRMTAAVSLIQALGGGWDNSQLPSPKEVTPQKPPKVAP